MDGKTVGSLVKVCANGYKEGKFNSENDLFTHLPLDIQNIITSKDKITEKYIEENVVELKNDEEYKLKETQCIDEHCNLLVKTKEIVPLKDKADTKNLNISSDKISEGEVVEIVQMSKEVSVSRYSNVNSELQRNKEQKCDKSILFLVIYVLCLIIMMFCDLISIVYPCVGIIAILATLICVNPKWYKIKAYRISNLVIGIVLLCIGGVILLVGAAGFSQISYRNEYIKQNEYTDMFEIQALCFGGIVSVSALLFLCVRPKVVSISCI